MYLMKGSFTITWAPDGAQEMTDPSAQSLEASYDAQGNAAQGFVIVPGGNAPTTGNILTACATLEAALALFLQQNIGAIQGWASGGD